MGKGLGGMYKRLTWLNQRKLGTIGENRVGLYLNKCSTARSAPTLRSTPLFTSCRFRVGPSLPGIITALSMGIMSEIK